MTINDVMIMGILAIAIIFVAVVLPIWIIAHYLAKSRTSHALGAQDEQLLADLWDAARRMEDRMDNIERIGGAEPISKSNRVREAAHV